MPSKHPTPTTDLLPIGRDGTVAGFSGELDETAREWLTANVAYYELVGFVEPWIAYLGVREGVAVGSCAFKGAPRQGTVEIAYGTLPAFEGQGVATEMAAALVRMARKADPRVRIVARTLPQEGASTAILKANGFVLKGLVEDPEDGQVWEWEHRPAK